VIRVSNQPLKSKNTSANKGTYQTIKSHHNQTNSNNHKMTTTNTHLNNASFQNKHQNTN